MFFRKNMVAILGVIFLFLGQYAQAIESHSLLNKQFSGWKIHQIVEGDLNGNGNPDIATILYKFIDQNDEKQKALGESQALLVIYLNDVYDSYQLNTKASKASCFGCGGIKSLINEPLGKLIIENGELHIIYEGGSRTEFTDELKWRFDNEKKKFFLIGETYFIVDTSPNPVKMSVGSDDSPPEELDDAIEEDFELPNDMIDIDYVTLEAKKTIVRNYLAHEGGKYYLRTKKETFFCSVSPVYKAISLEDFDYENKHNGIIVKILDECDDKIIVESSLLDR